jgi:hypothetical protein
MSWRGQAVFDAHGGADLSKACWSLGFRHFVAKRSVNCEPLSVSSLVILIGEASLSRRSGRRCFCQLAQHVME